MSKPDVHLGPLQALFAQQGKADAWPQTEAALAPWFRKDKAGRVSLKPVADIDAAAYSEAVTAATDKKVRKILFFSRADPFPKAEWMTGEMHRASVKALHQAIGWKHFWTGLGLKGGEEEEKRAAAVRGVLLGAFGPGLRAPLATFQAGLEETGLGATLVWTAAYALAGNKKKFSACTALLKVQEQAFTLGFKKDESDVLLVLCA